MGELEKLRRENQELREQHEIDEIRIKELRRKLRAKETSPSSQNFGEISRLVNQQELTISRLLKIKESNEATFEEMEEIHETDTLSHNMHVESLRSRITVLTSALEQCKAELQALKSETSKKDTSCNEQLEEAHRANTRLIYENSRLKALLEQNIFTSDFHKYLNDERIIRQEQITDLELTLLDQRSTEESLRAQLEKERLESASQIQKLRAELAACKTEAILAQTKDTGSDEVAQLRQNQKKLIRLMKHQVQEIEDLRSRSRK